MAALISSQSVIELGFAESIYELWKLNSKFFPSKIGGKPSWLDLRRLPPPQQLECAMCNKPRVFLLQVYAPIEESESTFHRTLFLFVCKTADCLKRSNSDGFLALRCQMPRENDCYSFEPPIESPVNAESPSSMDFNKLCDVCGCLGNKTCGKCHSRSYCGAVHQSIDWKSGHKFDCGKKSDTANSFLLKEYELVREAEQLDEACDGVDIEEKDTNDYKSCAASQPVSDVSCVSTETITRELEAIAMKSDKAFNKFKKRIAHEPNQVLRYERGGEPLWVSSDGLPENIPPCHSCGSSQIYEFQVMPQLLNYLQLDTFEDSMDWGTIVIYTCAKSCSGNAPYCQEFVWKQDFSEKNE